MKKILSNALVLGVIFLFSVSSDLHAGGPIVVDGNTGLPYTWGLPINLHPENGICAGFSNEQMEEKVESVFNNWSQPGVFDLEFDIVSGALGQGDIDVSNFGNFIALSSGNASARDGINPIIYDNTGEIINSVFGQDTAYLVVLGFAGPSNFATLSGEPTIIDGQAFFNCRCLEGHEDGSCAGGFSFEENNLDFIILHEMGHFLGLDHADLGLSNYFPTMYPQLRDAAQQLTLSQDDIWAISSLYNLEATQQQTGTIVGEIEDNNGNPIRCLNVIASTDDPTDTITTVTGYYATYSDNNNDQDSDDDGECIDNCGVFRLTGLDLEKSYTISIESINEDWVEGSAVGPCIQYQPEIEQSVQIQSVEFAEGQTLIQLGGNTGAVEVTDNDPENGNSNQTSSGSSGCQLSFVTSEDNLYLAVLFTIIFTNILYLRRERDFK